MPLYEYECTQCHRHTEKIQKFSDPEITVCPHCGGTLQRVISAPAIAFKGGGWYKDGYGNAKPAAASGDAGGTKDGSSKSDSSKDTKDTPATSATGDTNTSPAPSTPAAAPASTAAASSTEKK